MINKLRDVSKIDLVFHIAVHVAVSLAAKRGFRKVHTVNQLRNISKVALAFNIAVRVTCVTTGVGSAATKRTYIRTLCHIPGHRTVHDAGKSRLVTVVDRSVNYPEYKRIGSTNGVLTKAQKRLLITLFSIVRAQLVLLQPGPHGVRNKAVCLVGEVVLVEVDMTTIKTGVVDSIIRFVFRSKVITEKAGATKTTVAVKTG